MLPKVWSNVAYFLNHKPCMFFHPFARKIKVQTMSFQFKDYLKIVAMHFPLLKPPHSIYRGWMG